MNHKITVACITAVLAGLGGACQRERGAEPGEDQAQEPQVVPPDQRQEGNGQEGAAPGDGAEGRGAQAGEATKVGDLMENAENRVGQNVTVQGKIDEIFGDRGFKLAEEGMGGESVLVLGRQQVSALDQQWKDADVRVSGTLRRMTSADQLERELGWTFDSQLEDQLGDAQFVLIANKVERMQGGGASQEQRERVREAQDEMKEQRQKLEQERRELEQQQRGTEQQ